MKKQSIILFSIFVFIFTISAVVPEEAFASHTRRGSSSLSRKIRELDDRKVADLPMPILFGITPDNMYPDFGAQRAGHLHEGQDILAPKGAPVVTPTDAVVTGVGTGGSSGFYVRTANPGGETFVYMHLNEASELDEGDELQKGDLIGYVGNTGNAEGGVTHLHFEIRDGGATDPFPRLTRIFPLADKIKYLEKILDNADDERKLAEFIVTLYRRELVLAKTYNIVLPTEIEKALIVTSLSFSGGISGITRILQVGSRGDDVKFLQTVLGLSADGTFGLQTKSAVMAFQTSKGLVSDGVFGPISRAALANSTLVNVARPAGCTATTIFSPTTGVKC